MLSINLMATNCVKQVETAARPGFKMSSAAYIYDFFVLFCYSQQAHEAGQHHYVPNRMQHV